MNELDNIYEILQRIQTITDKSEEAGYAIMRILDQMNQIEQIMEEENV